MILLCAWLTVFRNKFSDVFQPFVIRQLEWDLMKKRWKSLIIDFHLQSWMCWEFKTRYKIAQKDTEPYHVVITWLGTQISFELLRSVHACVRGVRTPFRGKIEQSLDCKINAATADIWNTCLHAFILRAFYGRWFSRH